VVQAAARQKRPAAIIDWVVGRADLYIRGKPLSKQSQDIGPSTVTNKGTDYDDASAALRMRRVPLLLICQLLARDEGGGESPSAYDYLWVLLYSAAEHTERAFNSSFYRQDNHFFISIFNLLLHLSKLGKVEQSRKDLYVFIPSTSPLFICCIISLEISIW